MICEKCGEEYKAAYFERCPVCGHEEISEPDDILSNAKISGPATKTTL